MDDSDSYQTLLSSSIPFPRSWIAPTPARPHPHTKRKITATPAVKAPGNQQQQTRPYACLSPGQASRPHQLPCKSLMPPGKRKLVVTFCNASYIVLLVLCLMTVSRISLALNCNNTRPMSTKVFGLFLTFFGQVGLLLWSDRQFVI